MSSEVMRLYGRNSAKSLIREFLLRDERDGRLRNRRNPVLLFSGPRGIGKTALLTALQERYRSVPHAYIDCETAASNAREMLAMLAFDLNRQCGRYGALPFPRLITGELVITAKMELDPLDRNVARQQVTDLLERHQRTEAALEDAVRTILSGLVTPLTVHGAGDSATGEAIGDAVGDLAGKYVTKLLLGGLASTRRGRRILLGKGQEWYGDQGRGLGRDPLDALIDLRRMAARTDAPRPGGDASNRREVAEWLWAAFLADLQDSFHDRRAIDWTFNCVVLLDNADTPAGRAFLTELVDARAKRAREEPDPLTVIATSRGALAKRVRGVAAMAELADASYDDYLQRGRTAAERSWYPVALPPLTWNDTSDMVDALELRGDRPAATTAVHAFTGGHPGATAALLAAMAEQPPPAAAVETPAETKAPAAAIAPTLLAVLGQRKADGLNDDHETVEAAICNALLASAPKAAADLTTCAAARDKVAAERMAVATDSDLMEHLLGEELALFSGEFWSAESAGGRAALQPLLRRLLLRRLADRSADAPASWAHVHEWLGGRRKHPGAEQSGETRAEDAGGREVVRLYHALALGEVERVARELAAGLKTNDPAQWLRLVVRVTAAPNRLDHALEPGKQVRSLTAWVDPHELPIAPVARFLSYSWLGADPLSAPHWHWLLRQMALELVQIAPYSIDEGLSLLRREAERCREIGDPDTRWSEVEEFWATRAAHL
jgi:hypothetical protein